MSPEDKKLIDEIQEKTTDRVRQETRKLEQWILDNKYRVKRLTEMRDCYNKHPFTRSASWSTPENPLWPGNHHGEITFLLLGYGAEFRGIPTFFRVTYVRENPEEKFAQRAVYTRTSDIEQFVSNHLNIFEEDSISDKLTQWAKDYLNFMETSLFELSKKLGIESPVLPSKREELGAKGNGGEAKLFYGDVAPTSGGSCMLTPSTFPMSSGGSVTISAGSNKSL